MRTTTAAVQQFDAAVLKPLQAQGVTPVVLHHTGHRQMFSDRGGPTRRPRRLVAGAESRRHAGVQGAPARTASPSSTASAASAASASLSAASPSRTPTDGRVEIVEAGSPEERAVEELAEKMAQAILTASTRASSPRTNCGQWSAAGGSDKTAAQALLENDARVRMRRREDETKDGKHRDAKVWRAAHGNPLGERLSFDQVGE